MILVISFTVLGFGGANAMQSDGYDIGEGGKSLKSLDKFVSNISENNENSTQGVENDVEKSMEEFSHEDKQNKIIVVTKEEEEKKLKELHEDFCRIIKEFDKNYVKENFVLKNVSENYNENKSTELAENLAEKDLENNGYNVKLTYKSLDGLFRKNDIYCVAQPYNDIEESESAIFNSLNMLKDKFKELQKFKKNIKHEELLYVFPNQFLLKYKNMDKKYEKFMKLVKQHKYCVAPEYYSFLNSDMVFSCLEMFIESDDCDIDKTINYLLFYSAKILTHIKYVMNLDKKTIENVDDEFLQLLEDLKEEEKKALAATNIIDKFQKEVDVRNRFFSFIFKLGKIAEFYAEKHIFTLHEFFSSPVFEVKEGLYGGEGSWPHYITKKIKKMRQHLGNGNN